MKRKAHQRLMLAVRLGRAIFFDRHDRIMSTEEMHAHRERVAGAFLMARTHAQAHLRSWTQREREQAFDGFIRLQSKHGEPKQGWLMRESRRAWRELTALEAARA